MTVIKGKLNIRRVLMYALGMAVLALGLTLNTMTSLGAGTILCIPYTVSQLFGLDFGNMTLILYVLMIIVELILDRSNWLLTILQLPLSLVFTRFMNLYKKVIPYSSDSLPLNILVALIAVIFTGLGIFLTVNTDLIPNPADGFVNAVSAKSGLELGRTKSIIDIVCVSTSLIIGTVFGNTLAGVGIGTFLAMLLVGLVVSFINRHYKEKLLCFIA